MSFRQNLHRLLDAALDTVASAVGAPEPPVSEHLRGRRPPEYKAAAQVIEHLFTEAETGTSTPVPQDIVAQMTHDFIGVKIGMEWIGPSGANVRVHAIRFGDTLVYTHQGPQGVPLQDFGSHGMLSGIIDGHKLAAGFNMVIVAQSPVPGMLRITLVGKRPSLYAA